jgi:hypothetical protein
VLLGGGLGLAAEIVEFQPWGRQEVLLFPLPAQMLKECDVVVVRRDHALGLVHECHQGLFQVREQRRLSLVEQSGRKVW